MRGALVRGVFAVGLVLVAGCARNAGQLVDAPTTTTSAPATGRRGGVPRGGCLDWSDVPGHPDQVGTARIVDCHQPHRFQVTGGTVAPASPGDFYPSASAWARFAQTSCVAPAAALLGRPFDPNGRFRLTAYGPSEARWRKGDRTMVCGLGPATTDLALRISVDARGADQAYHWSPGDCVAYPPVAPDQRAVPCDHAHQMEVAGQVTYTDDDGGSPVGHSDVRCRAIVDAYLGHLPKRPWVATSERIAPESWDAGTHFAHCLVVQYTSDGGDFRVVTSSAKH